MTGYHYLLPATLTLMTRLRNGEMMLISGYSSLCKCTTPLELEACTVRLLGASLFASSRGLHVQGPCILSVGAPESFGDIKAPSPTTASQTCDAFPDVRTIQADATLTTSSTMLHMSWYQVSSHSAEGETFKTGESRFEHGDLQPQQRFGHVWRSSRNHQPASKPKCP